MIKKLRMRVIFSAMAAFFLVITVVSVLVNTVNYRIVTAQADEILRSIWNFENQQPEGRPRNRPEGNRMPPLPDLFGRNNPEAEFITRFFVVKYDEDGSILSISADNIAAASREKARGLAGKVITNKKSSGYIDEYRYLKEKNETGPVIIFLNVMQNQQHLRVLMLITLAVALSGQVVVSVLVVFFSGAAIRPIEENIQRQKQFITDAGHELKTPITSIVTSLDVITMEHGDDEWTGNIRKQAGRLSKLVEEMVTLSGLDEANMNLSREQFSISDASREMIEVYKPAAKAMGRKITTDIKNDIYYGGNKAAIQKMLSVLLDNAVRYSVGPGEIEFSLSSKHNRIMVEISNPADFKEDIDTERLFDRFYRPDSSRNSKDGGSGIGLAIAKTAAELHGGSISARCIEGKKMVISVIL